ncbi:Hydroxyacid oxidase 1 [Desmophyllum pertusum]|uniref:Hydroxyacid oxidase 1 n=1 Tax=Desmophyllum pertusum TaxID=174260 RepID=A0A9X0CCI6_9CNID|nr:Hydroxyacid oxidase 1 [Desmophyllum pertusum]
MGLSIDSTNSLEDVALESPNTIKFMQMQFYKDRQFMESVLKRAEEAGYKAILLTLDIPTYGEHKGRANFFLPEHLEFANFLSWKKKEGLQNNKEMMCVSEGHHPSLVMRHAASHL